MSFFSFEIKTKANIENEQISKRILFAEKKNIFRVCTLLLPSVSNWGFNCTVLSFKNITN